MFVVPMRRAISSEALTLIKSREGAPTAGHKYIKRERYFVHGKPAWRYYYRDDLQREAAKKHLDPKDEHEHLLLGQIKDIHEHLRGALPTATEATFEKIRSYFKNAKVEASPAFKSRYVDPYVEREKKGEDTERNSPLVRMLHALELTPKDVLAYIDEEMTGIRFREPNLDVEFEAHEGLQAFADPLDGALVMLGDRSWTHEPKGEPRFNSPGNATGAETTLWHELGHHWHNRFMKDNKSGWAEWVAINKGSEAKISDYATTNDKEDFAETFACALGHPKELLARCPERYFFMRKYVIKSLPAPTALNSKGDEEVAWWAGAAKSTASKILRYLKGKNPASRYHPYYSDKDQFFQMSQGGHTLYFRYGPPNKDDEALWKPVGNIFDEETGLPRYDVEYGQFFRMADGWKEIYDERGSPLDTKQAYFYLEQGNPASEALLSGVNKYKNYDEWTEARKAGTADDAEEPEEGEEPEAAGEVSGPSGEAKEKKPKSWKDTHTIDYRLYSLGGRTGATIEKERKRVEKEKKKGGTGYMPRHEYAPTEISAEEFSKLSGTFKLGGMANAPAERQVWRAIETDPKTKKQRALTAIDLVTGEPTPALRARVYEQKNADGTYARIEVNESAPFMPGNTIEVPGEDGWERWTIPDGFDATPARIAREHNTTARRILERNGRFTRGQIMNPILAALINPTGKPIEDEATLQQLMRSAAENDPPTRAWVTIRGSGDLDSSLAHMQVEFDGQGAPRVLGDYWRILTGKEDLRIDDLLNKDNTLKIKLPRIVEKPRTKLPIEPGNNVWVIDPKTKKRVMGVLAKRPKKNESGETIYNVQAHPGQGAGVSKTLISATEVQAAYSDELPGKEYRRRFVEPMEHQLLLYADNVKKDSGPYSTSGTIRLALPKDGSLTWENLSGIPGLQFEYETRSEKQGTKFITGATLSLNNFSDFRDGLGGFAMDERVQNMVQARMDSERILQSRTKTTLKDVDFEDADGNVNPEGVLRGLVTGRDGIQPGAHRIDALKKLAAGGGRMLAAHFMGTGKSALGIMASQMMRNLADPNNPDKAHPNRVTKKVLTIVPLNTAQNWFQEYKRFTGAPPTMIGSGTLAGAQQIFPLSRIDRKVNESDDAYYGRAITAWKEACKTEPNLWNPWADSNANVTVPFEYFRDNEALMRATGLFDGMIVDEAHKIFRTNEVSNAVERWNPHMKMFLMLTGTPVTNTLSILPRMVQLITAGKVSLAESAAAFSERYLSESQVLKALGAKNPAKTDLNPKRAGELAAKLQPLIHVATIADVKGKTMPSVLLDENEPAHMIGSQNLQYRAAVAALTDEDRAALETSGALGVDEQALLSEDGKKRIALARSIANSPGYKAPDQMEYVVFQEEKVDASEEEAKGAKGKGHGRKEKKVKKQTVEFTLPNHDRMTAKQPKGWGGKWPSWEWVEKGYMGEGEMKAWAQHMSTALGVDFDHVSGKDIDPAMLAALKKDGVWRSPTGVEWPGKLKNPDYGPEGVIARGTYDEATGITAPIVRQYFDSTTGKMETIEVPVGKRFIRDPNKKAAALYYDDEDWEGTGKFYDTGEAGDEDKGLEGDDEEGEGEGDEPKSKIKKNEQKPKEGREAFNINRHPSKRKARTMFDIALTTNNAKCAKLEETMRNVLSGTTGDRKGGAPQMIMFGNRVGSSVRCMEAKMRTMGYMDVNEALGNPDWSSEHDKTRGNGTQKFFVTYMGKAATLGDRDLNSEIFRRQQDDLGKDTGISMMTWRCLYGTTSNKLPKDGEIREGWSRAERKRIETNFASGTVDEDGKRRGLEVPMRVMGAQLKDGSLGQKYLYERDMKPKDRKAAQELEIKLRGAVGAEAKAIEGELATIFKPYWSTRVPLTPAQMNIFNSTEVMIASDAANVGLNWPAQHMIMYDSLFSPMDEWQRIARAARMLPDVVSKELRPLMDEIDTHVKSIEEKNGLREYDVEGSAAMAVMKEAIGMLSPDAQRDLAKLPGGAPDQILEAYFAKRALNKINNLRASTEDRLRKQGAVPDPNKPVGKDNYISPKAIVSTDVINEIIRHELTPFERKALADRRYLVDVKRLTVSAAVPVMMKLKSGQRVPARDENGQITYTIESPVSAERSILAQGRSKAVPYEYTLNLIQNAEAQPTKFDMIGTGAAQLAELSLLPEQHLERPVFRGRTQKSMRYYVLGGKLDGHP